MDTPVVPPATPPSTPGTERPGERALLAMQSLTNSVSIFKVPRAPQKLEAHQLHQPKKQKMKILTEERYIEELGKIIQKDFFPDLEKLKAQNQYLDAVERNDVIKLRELYAKYSGTKPTTSGCESPATFETPILNRGDATPRSTAGNFTPKSHKSGSSARSTSSKASPSDGHTLDSFLTHYTSEDNHSFHEIIEASDRKLRQKFAVLFEAEGEQAKQMAFALALPDIETQFAPIVGAKTVDTWAYTNKNYIMYVPDGVELTVAEQLEMAKRKQQISYANTRLEQNPFDERQNKATIAEVAKSHAKGIGNRIGVDGNYVDSTLNGSGGGGVRGFGFVKTPSPCPGVDQSPLMTWGEIEGTPFRLDGGDTPVRPVAGPSFRITETSRRENIALELADKACERKRGQKAKAIEAARRNIASPQIRSTLDRLASMSPAAKRLASSSSSTRRGTRDFMLTPSPRRGTTPMVGITMRKHTPSLVRRKTPIGKSFADGSGKSLLTDDLLKIPTSGGGGVGGLGGGVGGRSKAADFF